MLNIKNDQDLFCKFSRATPWAFIFVSVATLLAITVDRYGYIVKPLRYPQIVTHRRVFHRQLTAAFLLFGIFSSEAIALSFEVFATDHKA